MEIIIETEVSMMAVKGVTLERTNEAKVFDATLKIQGACESGVILEKSLVKETPKVALVKAGEEDLDTVRMINSKLKSSTHTGFLDENDMLDVFRYGTVFLVKMGEETVGTVSFRPDKEDSDTALLRNLAILPEYQGQGIGTETVSLLHNAVKELGFKKARGRVRPEKGGVLHMYEKIGFEVAGKDNRFGDDVPRLIIEKMLR